MPKNKEELYSLIHEFDDRVESMLDCIQEFCDNTPEDNFNKQDWAMIMVYCQELLNLRSAYKYVDFTLSNQ